MSMKVNLEVNGRKYTVEVDEEETLLGLLRNHLHLRGTKEGCGNGECGACTVIVDGEPVRSCLILAVEMEGRSITTVEGLARIDSKGEVELSPVQRAFIESGAVQCGFCTPGFVVAGEALLSRNEHPDESDIIEAFSGHLCRCTGYRAIIDGMKRAVELSKSKIDIEH
ncbi:MAG: (2Fe-2S)-binding protein [Spirochaetota bacterium]